MVWALSDSQTAFEERVRTIGIAITALGVLAVFLFELRSALLPLVLALFLKHLLEPLVQLLSVRPASCCGRECLANPIACRTPNANRGKRMQACCEYLCRLQLPRLGAVFVALLIAFTVLGLLGTIVAESVHVFAEHAEIYAHQLEHLLKALLGWVEWMTCGWTPHGCPPNGTFTNETNSTHHGADPAGTALEKLLSSIPLQSLVLEAVEAFLELCSNLFLVFLFTVYLMVSKPDDKPSEVDEQILQYIKGKVCLSLIVGITTALILLAVGLDDLWLVFGVLAFWLNFVPNVGAVVAVFLPMPLVILDPTMPIPAMVLAFVLPFSVHMVVGNVLEPLLFGHSLDLAPVVILLSLMVWYVLWGIVGMVVAVPIMVVLKIHLSHIDHPVAAFIVDVLVSGSKEEPVAAEESERMMQPAEEAMMQPLRASAGSVNGGASQPLVVPSAERGGGVV